MRTFVMGSGQERKFVQLDVRGRHMTMVQGKADGTTKRTEKELVNEVEASLAAERMAQELLTRGYVERTTGARPAPKSSAQAAPVAAAPAKTPPRVLDDDESDGNPYQLEVDEPAPVLPRVRAEDETTKAASPDASGTDKAKKKKKKRKKSGEEAADWKLIAGISTASLALVGLLGWFVWSAFLKPPSLVGTWQGSKVQTETGIGMIGYSHYKLTLDASNNVAMTLQESIALAGTYTREGDLLKLSLKDPEGEPTEMTYKIALGRAQLELMDPADGTSIVKLIRLRDIEPIGGAGGGGPAAPAVASPEVGGSTDADSTLASVPFSPEDGAFTCRHPAGWEEETGSRPDNTYSWARFTKGSAKIQINADIKGSLMAGPVAADSDPNSEFAPVASAHEEYLRTVQDEYEDYQESDPIVFAGSGLGTGRLAEFTAKGGGLVFAPNLHGYRATFLTSNRRVTVLCECPEPDFEELKPTFLAVCRGLGQ